MIDNYKDLDDRTFGKLPEDPKMELISVEYIVRSDYNNHDYVIFRSVVLDGDSETLKKVRGWFIGVLGPFSHELDFHNYLYKQTSKCRNVNFKYGFKTPEEAFKELKIYIDIMLGKIDMCTLETLPEKVHNPFETVMSHMDIKTAVEELSKVLNSDSLSENLRNKLIEFHKGCIKC